MFLYNTSVHAFISTEIDKQNVGALRMRKFSQACNVIFSTIAFCDTLIKLFVIVQQLMKFCFKIFYCQSF